jgi:Tol biopolymer transport system component/beta-lactamase regulating signal transducer with metallopeptidase domain
MPIDALLGWGVAALAAWLLTYGIHSTLLLGATWLLTARAVRSIMLKDLLWKAALVGGLITATIQVAGGFAPPALSLSLSDTTAASSSAQPIAEPTMSIAPDPPAEELADGPASSAAVSRTDRTTAIDPSSASISEALTRWATDGQWLLKADWPSSLVVLWLLGAAVGLARLAVQAAALRTALGQRREIVDGPLVEMLDRLRRSSGIRRRVRLSRSTRIASPVALAGSEICLPERAIDGLNTAQQRAMLAHELAHLIQHDPLWRAIAALVAGLCFFQPLNRLAQRRLQEAAEYLCDDWAAQQTGALDVARCLAEVATWIAAPAQLPIASGILGDGSPLIRRVERLLDARRTAEQRPRWWALIAIGMLLCVGCGAPVVVVPERSVDAPAREQILFSSERGGVSDLYLMDADGTSLHRLNTNQFDPSLAAWSPDGAQIAFNAGRWPKTDIYEMDAGGGNLRRLTSDGAENAHPTWSPDGARIAFASARDGNLEIYVMDADGGNLRRLTRNSDEDHKPVWSPDGRRIAFSSRHAGNVDIYVMDADGGNPRRLTSHPATDINPAWSPNGKQIAFNSGRSGNKEIYIMDADGGNVRRLLATRPGAWDEKPTWSPDGVQIAFYSNRDGNPDVYVIHADGTSLRRLTADNAGFDGQPIWLPANRGS